MPVFKCFYKIVNKNKWSMLIYVGIFMVLTLMFTGSSFSSESTTYSDTSLDIAVIDRDNSEMSKALTSYLGEIHTLTDLPDDKESLQDALFYRDVEYILFIPEGFGQSILDGSDNVSLENTRVPGSTTGVYVDNQIDRFLLTVKTYLGAGFDMPGALEAAADDMAYETAVEINAPEEEEAQGSAYFFQYFAYILICVVILALGPVLIAFNEGNLSRRIESSALKLREKNVQITLGCITVSFLIWLVFIAVAVLLYHKELSAVFALRAANSLVFLIVSVSLAYLLGQFLKNTNFLSAIQNILGLGMSFICGIFVPQSLLGEGVLTFAKFLPAYWYIRSNDMLFTETSLSGVDIGLYTEGILIQLGFAAAIFAAALAVSRQKKHSHAV